MKRKLSDILKNVEVLEISGSENIEITSIEFDSRKAGKGSLFAAIKGTKADGHNYISDVTTAGAAAIVCEELPSQYSKNTTYIKVKSSSHAFGIMASNFFDNPSEKLKLVGVTGTNGKTTIVTLLYDLYGKLGFVPGLLSTIRVMIGEKTIEATHTTPDALQLNKLLKQMEVKTIRSFFIQIAAKLTYRSKQYSLNFNAEQLYQTQWNVWMRLGSPF